jgi:hypothetical protein
VAEWRIQRKSPWTWERIETVAPVIEPGSREWWEGILAEKRPYTPGGTALEEKTSRDLKFNPYIDQKSVYREIIGNSIAPQALGLKKNKYIWEQVLSEHPEWLGVSFGSVTTPRELRLAAVNAFLEKSGGRMFVKPWTGNEVKLADFNQPVQFECSTADKITGDGLKISDTLINGEYFLQFGVRIEPNGQVSYVIQETETGWKNLYHEWTRAHFCGSFMMGVIESQAWGTEVSLGLGGGMKHTYMDWRVFAPTLKDLYLLAGVHYNRQVLFKPK